MEIKSNQYDRIAIKIPTLFENVCVKHQKEYSFTRRLINRYTVAGLILTGLYSRLVDAGIIRGWYNEFTAYWDNILDGRPLYFGDFNYLLGVYRQKFQAIEVPSNVSKEVFLESWQGDDTLYQLFGAVRRFAHEPLHCYQFEKWISHGDTILEYGCGIAPISYSLLRFGLKRSLKITIADIQQINSHYAKWRLGGIVKFIQLEPYKHDLAPDTYDVVFMSTVMEHLPDPYVTMEAITASVKKGGTLIFDYIFSHGDGLDTIESVEQRQDVLAFIEQHYEISSGRLINDESMGVTVCRRK